MSRSSGYVHSVFVFFLFRIILFLGCGGDEMSCSGFIILKVQPALESTDSSAKGFWANRA